MPKRTSGDNASSWCPTQGNSCTLQPSSCGSACTGLQQSCRLDPAQSKWTCQLAPMSSRHPGCCTSSRGQTCKSVWTCVRLQKLATASRYCSMLDMYPGMFPQFVLTHVQPDLQNPRRCLQCTSPVNSFLLSHRTPMCSEKSDRHQCQSDVGEGHQKKAE